MKLTQSQRRDIADVQAAYGRTTVKIRSVTTHNVESIWKSLTSFYDDDIVRFVKAAVPQVIAGQTHMASSTGAALNRIVTIQAPKAKPVIVPAKAVTGAAVRGGTPPSKVYGRVGPTVWTALSNGDSLDDAADAGWLRASVMLATDLQLALTNTAQFVTSQSNEVTGYRRVLSGDASCALCVIASTQRYHDGDLMPIHDRCSCTVEPIVGDTTADDHHGIIDEDTLNAVRDDIQARLGTDSSDAADLKHLVIVHDHGEIGPVLAVRGQTFTGPDDIPDE